METSVVKAEDYHLPIISYIEYKCFPPEIAYPYEKLKEEYLQVPDRFYLTKTNGMYSGYFWSEFWEEPKDDTLTFDYMKNTVHNENGKVLYVANLAVLPGYRGQKIAHLQMEHMLQDLPKVNYAIIAVDEGNADAIHLYKKFGFVVTETFQNYYPGYKNAYVLRLNK